MLVKNILCVGRGNTRVRKILHTLDVELQGNTALKYISSLIFCTHLVTSGGKGTVSFKHWFRLLITNWFKTLQFGYRSQFSLLAAQTIIIKTVDRRNIALFLIRKYLKTFATPSVNNRILTMHTIELGHCVFVSFIHYLRATVKIYICPYLWNNSLAMMYKTFFF